LRVAGGADPVGELAGVSHIHTAAREMRIANEKGVELIIGKIVD